MRYFSYIGAVVAAAFGGFLMSGPAYPAEPSCESVLAELYNIQKDKNAYIKREILEKNVQSMCTDNSQRMRIAEMILNASYINNSIKPSNVIIARALVLSIIKGDDTSYYDKIYDLVNYYYQKIDSTVTQDQPISIRDGYVVNFATNVIRALHEKGHPRSSFSLAKSKYQYAISFYEIGNYSRFEIEKNEALSLLDIAYDRGDDKVREKINEIRAILNSKSGREISGSDIALFIGALAVAAAITSDYKPDVTIGGQSENRCQNWQDNIDMLSMAGERDMAAAMALGGC